MRRLLFVLALAACSTPTTTPAPAPTPVAVKEAAHEGHKEPAPAAAGATAFGQAFEKKEPVQLATIAQDATPFLGKSIQLEGKISAVCQKAGCWMELTDDATKTRVRILMKDHAFGMPKDCTGKTAIAEGMFTSNDVPQEEAAHLAGEAGQPIPTGPVKELRLEATGVMFAGS